LDNVPIPDISLVSPEDLDSTGRRDGADAMTADRVSNVEATGTRLCSSEADTAVFVKVLQRDRSFIGAEGVEGDSDVLVSSLSGILS
jgi:hypothetical protein